MDKKRKKKPSGYWRKRENVIKEALKYETKSEFCKKANPAYNAAVKQGWLNDCCGHMKNAKIKYTDELILAKAGEYDNISDFRKYHACLYEAARRRDGMIDKIRLGMKKRYFDYTKETCHNEALKYKCKKDFKDNNFPAYFFAKKEGIFDEVCSHMHNGNRKISNEDIHTEALKYKTRKQFEVGSLSHYKAAVSRRLLDSACSHMKPDGSRVKRKIYACVFSDNHAYIGLTCNIERRFKERDSNPRDSVTIHKTSTGLNYTIIELTDFIDFKKASELETFYYEKYKIDGWFMLNKSKTGGLGGSPNLMKKWNKDSIWKVVYSQETYTHFSRKYGAAYAEAGKIGIREDIKKYFKKKEDKE